MTTAYPADFPVESVTSVISILRGGDVQGNLPTLAHDIWNVQGYVQRLLIGDPPAGIGATNIVALQVPHEFDGLEELDRLRKRHRLHGFQASAVDLGKWKLVLQWLLTLMQQYLNQ